MLIYIIKKGSNLQQILAHNNCEKLYKKMKFNRLHMYGVLQIKEPCLRRPDDRRIGRNVIIFGRYISGHRKLIKAKKKIVQTKTAR